MPDLRDQAWPQGTGIAPVAPEGRAPDHGLPPGVHPLDPSGPDPVLVPHEQAGQLYGTGQPPWKIDNDAALPVYQRAAGQWRPLLISLQGAPNGVLQLVGKQKGRLAVVLSVPTTLPNGSTSPNGVLIGCDPGAIENAKTVGLGAVYVLNAGDTITLPVEADIWAGLIGSNTTGWVQLIDLVNLPGGGLGGA